MFRLTRSFWILSLGVLSAPVHADSPAQPAEAAALSNDSATEGSLSPERLIAVHNFEDLCQLAKRTAAEVHLPMLALPEPLASWSYDDYIKVSFKPNRATWLNQGLPFRLETFHRGFVQVDRVDLFTLTPLQGSDAQAGGDAKPQGKASRISDKVCQRINFTKDDFEYADPLHADALPSAGHAGLRIIGRFPGQANPDELLTFLGSSYFRGRSGDCVYGASARGLAINIAMNQREEFPDFRSFWIETPTRQSKTLTVLGLLDSPSVAGAYRFAATPHESSLQIEVDAQLFFRTIPDKVAIAPLTSMWMWGDGLKGPAKDQRPSVHDSDGLLIRSGEQDWTWRAFARQDYPSVTSFNIESLQGFGLIQRDRDFEHYADSNARYHRRPSVWITPQTLSSARSDTPLESDASASDLSAPGPASSAQWNGGTIELLELPSAHEGVDNLAAYWLPSQPPKLGQAYPLKYKVEFFAGDPPEHDRLARVTDLSVIRHPNKNSIDLKIQFQASKSPNVETTKPLRVASNLLRGELGDATLEALGNGDLSLNATITPTEAAPVEVSLQILRGDTPVSETFRYLLPPNETEFVFPAVYTRQE